MDCQGSEEWIIDSEGGGRGSSLSFSLSLHGFGGREVFR